MVEVIGAEDMSQRCIVPLIALCDSKNIAELVERCGRSRDKRGEQKCNRTEVQKRTGRENDLVREDDVRMSVHLKSKYEF